MVQQKVKTRGRLPATRIIALGFIIMVVLGGLLLYLPASNNAPIDFWNAMFTSGSAVCVTRTFNS